MTKTVFTSNFPSDQIESRTYLTAFTKNSLYKDLTNYNDVLRNKDGKAKGVSNTIEIKNKYPVGFSDSIVIENRTITFEFDCKKYSLIESGRGSTSFPKDSNVTLYNNKLTSTLGKPKYKSTKFQLKTNENGYAYQGIYTFYH